MIGRCFSLQANEVVAGRCGLMPSYLVSSLTDRWLPKLHREEACLFVYRPFNSSCVWKTMWQLSAISLAHSRQRPGGWDAGLLCWMSDRKKVLQWERKGREDRSLPGGSGGEGGYWRGGGGLCFRETVEENLKYWPWKTTVMIIIISLRPSLSCSPRLCNLASCIVSSSLSLSLFLFHVCPLLL